MMEFQVKRRAVSLFLLGLPLLAAGCASSRNQKIISDLGKQLSAAKLEIKAKTAEIQELKKENALFKQSQNIDSAKFMQAAKYFEEAFKEDIQAEEVWLKFSERGLAIIVSAEKLFDSGSDNLSDSGREFLDRIYDFIKQRFSSNYIYVEGHTDNQPLAIFDWKSDWEFSFARALSVVKYFTEKKGMDPLKFSASGFGQYRPRASNDTKEGRRLNRRVEIVISPHRLKGPMVEQK